MRCLSRFEVDWAYFPMGLSIWRLGSGQLVKCASIFSGIDDNDDGGIDDDHLSLCRVVGFMSKEL